MLATSPSSRWSLPVTRSTNHQQVAPHVRIEIPGRVSRRRLARCPKPATLELPNMSARLGFLTLGGIPSHRPRFANCVRMASRNRTQNVIHRNDVLHRNQSFHRESYLSASSRRRHMICRSGEGSSFFSTKGSSPACWIPSCVINLCRYPRATPSVRALSALRQPHSRRVRSTNLRLNCRTSSSYDWLN